MKKALTADHLEGWEIPEELRVEPRSLLNDAGEVTVPSVLKSECSPQAKLWLLCHEDLVAPKRLVSFYTKIAGDRLHALEDAGTALDEKIGAAVDAAQSYIMGKMEHDALQDIRKDAYAACALLTPEADLEMYTTACMAARCAVIPRVEATARSIVSMAANTEEDYERYLQLMVKMLKRKKRRKK